MIIYKNDNVVISYNSELMCVHQKWTGFCPGEIFREAIDHTFSFLEANNIYKIVADSTEQSVVCPKNQEYAKSKVLQFTIDYKPVRAAYIIKEKSRVKPSLNRYFWMIKKETDDELFASFNTHEEALEWIKIR